MATANVLQVVKLLQQTYPHVKYYLSFSSPLQLLVAAILSAQVRDEAVNAATPALFAKYGNAEDFARTDAKDIEKMIAKLNFAAAKAKNIKEACRLIVEKHGGRVPRTMAELIALPGVGRKTANVVLINAFGVVEGIPCDTHVIRIAARLGWSKGRDGDSTEQDLMKIVPQSAWVKLPRLLKAHGRAVCKAPVPECSKCVLNKLCPKIGVVKKL